MMNRPTRFWLSLAAAVPAALLLGGMDCAGARPKPAKESQPIPGADLFVPAPLRKIKVEITGQALEQLRRDNRRFVRATFREGDTVLTNVGVHLKGAAGSFQGVDQRPALTVKFDHFVPGQHWHGLQKIHLNNSVQDGSYMTENLCGELFRQAGVPAARACNARVEFNKRDLGIYVLMEGLDKTFLRQYYRNAKGNLYDGGFCKDIDQPLDKICGSTNKSQPEIKALVAAANDRDLDRRFQKLQELLDLDRFVSFCALEVMTWDWDGYYLKPNNYKLYWEPDSKKITFLPHGMDQMFWEPQGPTMPGCNGLVARALLETPEGRRLYRARITELTTNVFLVESITNRLYAYATHVHAAIAEKDPNAARDYDGQVQRIRDLVTARAAYLRRHLILPPAPRLAFEDGVGRPTGWTIENDPPVARLEKGRDSSGRSTLGIRTGERGVASWRCRLQLPGGHYRFEGMARVAEVAAIRDELGEGAGLRISGTKEPRANKLTGTAPWQTLAFEFDVAQPAEDVTLVCELRATRGQVWFDADSLKVIKVK
jgi:spore coat protein H